MWPFTNKRKVVVLIDRGLLNQLLEELYTQSALVSLMAERLSNLEKRAGITPPKESNN